MAGNQPLDPVDVIIGNMAMQQKLVDEGQLAEARMMLSMDANRTLAQVLYSLGYVSIQQAEKLEHAAQVLRAREEDKLVCEMAVKRRMITAAQAEEVLTVQKNATRNPGPIPRVRELLVNREFIKGPMVDILMDLVKQVSPYGKPERAPEPPKPPPGQKPESAGTEAPPEKRGDTARIERPPPGEKKTETSRFERPSGHVGPPGARQSEPPRVAVPPRRETPAPGSQPAVMSASDALKQRIGAREGSPPTPLPAKVEVRPHDRPTSVPGAEGARIAQGSIFTHAVQAGHTPECRPTTDPIHPSVTYDFPTMEALEDFLKGSPGFWYSRHGNPTVRAAEEKIAALEGAEDAVIASSGLGALTAAVWTLLRPGDSIATTDGLYGGTWHLFNEILPEYNIQNRRVPAKDWLMIREHIAGSTKIIYFEPVTNPMLRVWDPRPAAREAKRLGILTMVDNTFATPFNLRPIEHGVDLVLHSATKYLGGHSDLTAGVICGRKDLVTRIRERLKFMGATLSAFDAWLLIRGLKTFPIRMRVHNENALHVARALSENAKIRKVWHPALDTHPDRVIAREILHGFGGIVTFELEGGLEGAKAFCNRLKLCHRAVSLGGVETLVSIPVLSSHYQIPDRDLERAGITPGCVRLSVGIEDADDILADVTQALG